ncbi:flippase activity-associated protein Agl23 [Halobacterium zhouii]|uniref:flippase activity-associated protein Agl23 n=1 Tax=Halobacterium zhouii TaxID=2902624 RepID=UPI001E5E9130|nr:flippase activity-associated protein Agl23 [Halobacterium zhouii]
MSRSRDAGRERAFTALVGVTALALLARLWNLGWRVAHQDEGRVAHWTLHYMDVGVWEYRPIIHGPFLPHVNGVVFSLLGPSDFTMRLVVALIGGLLPLSVWLYREHLRNAELVGVAAFLAANPILLYYSRFMRNDLLVAAFMFVAVGLFVRAYDTGKARYLYAAALPFALAFTAKESAMLYVVCWVGALALILDGRLSLARVRDASRIDAATEYAKRTLRAAWNRKLHVALASVEAAIVVVAFYAPKPDLYRALSNPERLPAVVSAATLGTWEKFLGRWGSTNHQAHSYIAYLEHDLNVLVAGALALTAFAVLGFLHERYATERPRAVVFLSFFWGLFALFGFPVVMDITAGWTLVNSVVPLALPAGVGVGVVVSYGRDAVANDNAAGARAAAVILLVAAAGTGAVAAQTTYVNAQGPDNPLVQYAQPAGHMKPTLHDIRDLSASNEGVDVMFYGSNWNADDDLRRDLELNNTYGGYAGWFDRLPLPWYLEVYGSNVSSTTHTEEILEHDPPVVVLVADETNDLEVDLTERGYRRVVHQGFQYAKPVVFYVRENASA